jgi:hypothetical protein
MDWILIAESIFEGILVHYLLKNVCFVEDAIVLVIRIRFMFGFRLESMRCEKNTGNPVYFNC